MMKFVLLLSLLCVSCTTCFRIDAHHIEEFDTAANKKENKSVIDEVIEENKATNEYLFEGDIKLPDIPEGDGKLRDMFIPATGGKPGIVKRELRNQMEYLWFDRIVPYEIPTELESARENIVKGMKEISRKSCIRFVEHTDENDWIKFVDKGGCFSSVGRHFYNDQFQEISLTKSCQQNQGNIMHELLHALGFWHEQSRPDRDRYVEIFWENIKEGQEHNFDRYRHDSVDSLGSNYDINSIMHYGRYTFSKNGKPTLAALNPKDRHYGQGDKLSTEDIIQLNLLYKCKDQGKIYSGWSEWSVCFPDTGCESTRQRFCSNYNKVKCPEANIYGVHEERRSCPWRECFRPVDGHWNRWSSWSPCNQPCGQGSRERKRVCDDPVPDRGGKPCEGSSEQVEECFVKPCGLGPDDCLFDGQRMCYWKDISKEGFRWQRIKGSTPSKNTGPKGDHTSGKSFYMYAEASGPAQPGQKALLESKSFPPTNSRCIEFFYNMHGLGIGAMRVYLMEENTVSDTKIWEKIGPQGEGWKNGKAHFASANDYKVVFEGERGPNYIGDIGLDDIHFFDGSCDGQPMDTTLVGGKRETTTTLPPPTLAMLDQLSSKCGMKVRPLGCFKEITRARAFPYLLDSHRGPASTKFHGPVVEWDNYKRSLEELFCDCLHVAKRKHMKYIALQFYGECWATHNSLEYNKYGISTTCVDENFDTCYHVNKNSVCMGRENTNYVYELKL